MQNFSMKLKGGWKVEASALKWEVLCDEMTSIYSNFNTKLGLKYFAHEMNIFVIKIVVSFFIISDQSLTILKSIVCFPQASLIFLSLINKNIFHLIRNQTTKNASASALTFHDAYTLGRNLFINFLSLLIFITATFWRRNFFNKSTLIRKFLILMSCFWCILWERKISFVWLRAK